MQPVHKCHRVQVGATSVLVRPVVSTTAGAVPTQGSTKRILYAHNNSFVSQSQVSYSSTSPIS